jgi:hypothetical protein
MPRSLPATPTVPELPKCGRHGNTSPSTTSMCTQRPMIRTWSFLLLRGQAEIVWGATYSNHYAFRFRFRNEVIQEHLEFFDPIPVWEVFKGRLPQ